VVQNRIGCANPVAFRIADTCTNRLTRLTGKQQSAVKTIADDLPLNPVQPVHVLKS
jgi:hypothetical protein